MALATVTTKQKTTPIGNPKNTKIKAAKTQAKSVVSSILNDTISPYDLLSERVSSLDRKIDSVEKNLLTEIKATNTRIEGVRTELLTEIKTTNTRIDALDEKLTTRIDATNTRIDGLENSMNTRIDSLEKSMNRSFTMLTIVMAFVGIGIALLQIFGR